MHWKKTNRVSHWSDQMEPTPYAFSKSIDPAAYIAAELGGFAQLLANIAAEQTHSIALIADLLTQVLRDGHKVLLFGNGGSAADAQHIAAELVGRYRRDRPALPALALNTDTSSLTSIGNDYGYSAIFARQVEAHARPGDVVIGISTSGNSPNVLEGVLAARRCQALTVGLTGGNGGRLAGVVDYCIVVPSRQTPHIQQAHMAIGHLLCDLVEQALFPLQGDSTL